MNKSKLQTQNVFAASLISLLSELILDLCRKRKISEFRSGLELALQALFNAVAAQRGMNHAPVWISQPRGRSSVLQALEREIIANSNGVELIPEHVGLAFEGLYGKNIELDQVKGSNRRRDHGVYFTPLELVSFLTRITLDPLLTPVDTEKALLSLRAVDPAVGAGFFVLAMFRQLANKLGKVANRSRHNRLRRDIATMSVYGVDRDELATKITKALLWLELGDPLFPMSELDHNIRCGDSLVDGLTSSNQAAALLKQLNEAEYKTVPLDWSAAFPAVFSNSKLSREQQRSSFDIIISNPPWGKIKSDLKERFLHVDSRVSDYQGRALRRFILRRSAASIEYKKWGQATAAIKNYAELLRSCDIYHSQNMEDSRASGDADFYKYFLERAHSLVREGGRIGMVIPASFARAASATALRHLYLKSGTIDHFLEFENRQRLFPIHGMFKFALMTYSKGSPHGIKHAAFAIRSTEEARAVIRRPDLTVSMPLAFLKRVSGKYNMFPEVRSASEQNLLEKLHSRFPPLGEHLTNSWNVSFRRELDMTNDSDQFKSTAEISQKMETLLRDAFWSQHAPVYEGRMVHQFDYAAKVYVGGQGRRAVWKILPIGEKRVFPHYVVKRPNSGAILPIRAGFCDVTGHANERTVLAAIIPSGCICGNKVPTCVFDQEDLRLHLIWIAIANSFVMDWIIRRRISTTLNFFYWSQVPFPRISPDTPIGQELLSAAARLSLIERDDSATSKWLRSQIKTTDCHPLTVAERAILRARIDSRVAALFEITSSEYALILSDFKSLDRFQPVQHSATLTGEKSTITCDKALLEYLKFCGDSGSSFAGYGDEPIDIAQRVRTAEFAGAVAYVPSQLAATLAGRTYPFAKSRTAVG